MAMLDIIILVVLFIGAVSGMMKGFIRQLATLLGLIIGLVAAKALYEAVAQEWIGRFIDSMTMAQILAFLLIWIGVPLAFSLVAWLLTKAMDAIALGWLNRLLGAALGMLKFLLMAALMISVFEFFDADNKIVSKTIKSESVLYYPLKEVAGLFIPAAKSVTEQLFNDINT